MKKDTKYKCVADYQDSDFHLGETKTIQEWRDIFVGYAEDEELLEIITPLKKLPNKEIMDCIAEIWQIEFELCTNNISCESKIFMGGENR